MRITNLLFRVSQTTLIFIPAKANSERNEGKKKLCIEKNILTHFKQKRFDVVISYMLHVF